MFSLLQKSSRELNDICGTVTADGRYVISLLIILMMCLIITHLSSNGLNIFY
jgi:hypothetical protein